MRFQECFSDLQLIINPYTGGKTLFFVSKSEPVQKLKVKNGHVVNFDNETYFPSLSLKYACIDFTLDNKTFLAIFRLY